MPSRRALVIALHRLDRSPLPLYARADLEAELLALLAAAEVQVRIDPLPAPPAAGRISSPSSSTTRRGCS